MPIEGASACYCLAARRAARHLARIYERHLAPVGLTSSQFSILAMLRDEPGMLVADLARAMEMDRTTLVRLLKPMKERGWVAENGRDGRAIVLEISDAGLERFDLAHSCWSDAQEEFEQAVGVEEAREFQLLSTSLLTSAQA